MKTKMKKVFSAIGKKNVIIISGILLVGVAIYLNLNLNFIEGDYFLAGDYDESRLGQASLVDNLNFLIDSNNLASVGNMGAGAGGGQSASVTTAEDLVVPHVPQDEYFAITVMSRQRARDESIELLNSIASHAEALPDVRDRALSDIADIAREIEREANIETLVRAKGFLECVAVVSGDIANIIVKTNGLMPNEVAQIKEIVYEQAGLLPRNVKIIERN